MAKKIIQTVPIDPDDKEFRQVFDFINELMRKRGYPVKTYKGSYSWLPPHEVTGAETLGKLCYLGQDNYLFGLRKEECAKFGMKPNLLRLLWSFGVRPKPEPTFYGFPVHNDGKTREALEKFVGQIPEAPLDRQLEALSKSDEFDINEFLKQF